jgi:hypothetical protein
MNVDEAIVRELAELGDACAERLPEVRHHGTWRRSSPDSCSRVRGHPHPGRQRDLRPCLDAPSGSCDPLAKGQDLTPATQLGVSREGASAVCGGRPAP